MHSQGKCEVSLWLRAQINGFLDQRLLVLREESRVEQMNRRGSGAKSNGFFVALGRVTDGILGLTCIPQGSVQLLCCCGPRSMDSSTNACLFCVKGLEAGTGGAPIIGKGNESQWLWLNVKWIPWSTGVT